MELDARTLTGSAIALLGASQVLLSFEYLLGPEFVVLAGGGWLLIGVGVDALSGRTTIATRIPDGRFGLAGAVACNALSIALVVATTDTGGVIRPAAGCGADATAPSRGWPGGP